MNIRAINTAIKDGERRGFYAYSTDYPQDKRVIRARMNHGKFEMLHLHNGKWYLHHQAPCVK